MSTGDDAANLVAGFHAAILASNDADDMLESCWLKLDGHGDVRGMALVSTDDAERPGTVLAATGDLDWLASVAPAAPVGLPEDVQSFAVDGGRVARLLICGHVAPTSRVALPALGAMLDLELHRRDIERDLNERVKELEALRAVQGAVEAMDDVGELRADIVEAMVFGMQFPDAARAELTIGGQTVAAGADGTLSVLIAADIEAAGRHRGSLRVGYVRDLRLLDPEEYELVRAAARTIGLHLEASDARRQALASAERLRQVLDGLPSAIFTVDRDLRGQAVTLAEHFPADRLPEAGTRLTEWADPIAEHVMTLVGAAFSGVSRREELLWQDRWWELRVDPQHDDGPVELAVVSVLDVTDQRARADAEARLAALVDAATLPIVGLDRNGVISTWNRGAGALFGWRAEEAVGRPMGAFEEPGGRDGGQSSVIERRLDALIASGTSTDRLEVRCRHRRGRQLYLAVHLSLIIDPAGTPIGALATCEDLTRHQRVVAALEDSEAQFRVIAESVADVVYRMSLPPGPRFEYVSPSASAVLGYAPLELLNDLHLMVRRSHPDDARGVERHLAHVGSTIHRWRWRRSDGSWRWVEDHRNLLERDGRQVAIVGVIRDVTAAHESVEAAQAALDNAHRVADELRQVDLMKSTFLAAVSHELRTPLTSIIGFSETVARMLPEDAGRVRDYVGRMVANARRLEQLVDDLLDLDRLTRGQVTPRSAPTDLAALIERVIRRAEVEDELVSTDLVPVVADVDAVMIDRAVANLVRNVRRHTPVGTRMWISLRATTSGVRIVVEDDGPGVPAADHQRIFEPFEQGLGAAFAASPGTGVGLSLVQRFVEAHGGQVTLTTRRGGGARFVIDLPGTAAT